MIFEHNITLYCVFVLCYPMIHLCIFLSNNGAIRNVMQSNTYLSLVSSVLGKREEDGYRQFGDE